MTLVSDFDSYQATLDNNNKQKKTPLHEDKHLSPLEAIRAKCLDCSGGSWKEVELCVLPNCPLYPYRFGKNPYRKKRELTEEQKEALKFRLQNSKNKKDDS